MNKANFDRASVSYNASDGFSGSYRVAWFGGDLATNQRNAMQL